MATTKNFFLSTMEQLKKIPGVSSRAMMHEYILYYKAKVIGGIYDNRILLKPTDSARESLPKASLELPYDGAKLMLRVEDISDVKFLEKLFKKMYNELPVPKKRK